jgi:hypothetical protein
MKTLLFCLALFATMQISAVSHTAAQATTANPLLKHQEIRLLNKQVKNLLKENSPAGEVISTGHSTQQNLPAIFIAAIRRQLAKAGLIL